MPVTINGTTGNISASSLTGVDTGKILQVVTAELSTQASVTSTTHQDLGASGSIQVLRGSTVILTPYDYGSSNGFGDYFMSSGEGGVELGTFLRFRHGYKLIDSPNTTSSTTYKLQGAIGYGGYLYLNKTDNASGTPKSNIILTEVAA